MVFFDLVDYGHEAVSPASSTHPLDRVRGIMFQVVCPSMHAYVPLCVHAWVLSNCFGVSFQFWISGVVH